MQKHTAHVKLGDMPPMPPAASVTSASSSGVGVGAVASERRPLFTVRMRGRTHVVFDGAVVDGDERLGTLLARHGVENKRGEQDGDGE